ncbi:MAG: hypothetical protein AAB217_03210, partial [Chloroflexota bacterium]
MVQADPNTSVNAHFINPGTDWVWRSTTAGENGLWVMDFSQPGPNPGEETLLDIKPGTGGAATQWGLLPGEGGQTHFAYNLPNPSFSARLTENEVHGYGWPVGANVTLTLDDPATPQSIDFTDTRTVVVADWDPNQTFVRFEISALTLQPGMSIALTDGVIPKSHTVASLAITAVDPDADTVSGTAAPGSEIHVGHICDENGCAFRRVFADANDNWIADFSVPGEDGDEQETFDIRPGTGNEARQPDDDGDTTNVQWRVPNPTLAVRLFDAQVEGWEWPLGADVTLAIDDPLTPQNPDYTDTQTVGIANWDPNQTYVQFNFR